MTEADVNVIFSKHHSSFSKDNVILAYGPKISNLFTYTAISIPAPTGEATHYSYSNDPPEPTLWHHRLTHTNYSTIKKMVRKGTAKGFIRYLKTELTSQCANCPFGKQMQAPFKRIEDLPTAIGNIIVSDLCGPFEMSIGGYKYFITWIDLKSR